MCLSPYWKNTVWTRVGNKSTDPYPSACNLGPVTPLAGPPWLRRLPCLINNGWISLRKWRKPRKGKVRGGSICIKTLVAWPCFEQNQCRCEKNYGRKRIEIILCQWLHVVATRLRRSPWTRGLAGVEPFAKAHKLKTPEAQRILQSVLSYTLLKPWRTGFPTTPTLVFDRDEQWQMDLVDMQKLSRWNKGHKCLLTVIDVLSKYAWAVPIKSKSSKEIIRWLAGIYNQASPRRPLRVQTDQGKEFYNAGVQAWFKKQATYHFSTFGDSKASVVELWHCTLKQRMYRYFTAHNPLRYVDVLQPLIHTHNQSCHRSIGIAAHQVTEKTVPQVWDKLYGHRLDQKTTPPKCQVGDRVRLNKKHRPFKKRLFTRMDGRSVCGQWMGRYAYKRHVLQTRCTKLVSVVRLVISGGKSLETQRTQRVRAMKRVAVQVR